MFRIGYGLSGVVGYGLQVASRKDGAPGPWEASACAALAWLPAILDLGKPANL